MTTGVVTIIGAGLAGSEAAWQIAERGIAVRLYEMRPGVSTKAHTTGNFAELVCSNSFRGAALSNAVGLLKEELRLSGSVIMQAADEARVPAGGALAVDRDVFSALVTDRIRSHPRIEVIEEEVTQIPEPSLENPVIIATGPLTSRPLTEAIETLTGEQSLAFFDAISPILFAESIDMDKVFRQSRYGKGGTDDYLNVALDKEQYYWFIDAVQQAEKYTGNIAVETDSLDKLRPFEGCMPIEDMIERGPETLRYGPFKPRGLVDPNTDQEPYAVLQLRQDDKEATLWSMVGMQTRMKRADQERIFTALPGLEQADFVRYGSVHRNTFINSPECLDASLAFTSKPGLFFAGQITGVEGYVESTAGGLVAGINAARMVQGAPGVHFPADTAIGSLIHYVSHPERKEFQPMNVSFGLMSSYAAFPKKLNGRRLSKADRRIQVSQKALDSIESFMSSECLRLNQ